MLLINLFKFNKQYEQRNAQVNVLMVEYYCCIFKHICVSICFYIYFSKEIPKNVKVYLCLQIMSILFLIVMWEGRFMDIDFFLVLILVISEVFKISFYFWLHCVVFVTSCGLSLTVASRGHSTVAMCRLLIDFSCCRAQALGTLASFSSCSVWL